MTTQRSHSGRVAGFEPADRPVLWWPAGLRETAADDPGERRATLLLNASNSAVERLVGAHPDADLSGPVRALYVVGLLLARLEPTVEQVALLRGALLGMIEAIPPGDDG